ncbi:MAG: leucine-rich repeat protein [Muribaculaceae bacterium]|nr:leucine-rich repeat protein [Muribaculaceae bacterium]
MKHLNILLRAALLLLILPISLGADAITEFYYQGIMFRFTGNGTCKVIQPGWYSENGYSGVINIPRTVNAAVYDAWSSNSTGTNVSLIVTGIDDNAFRDCSGLTSVTIPNTVTNIGKNAFYGCRSLTSVTIPNSVDTIQASAFAKCWALTSVNIPNSVRYLGWNAFYDCSALTSVTISSSVRELNGTFCSCSALTSVNVPSSVVKLDRAFINCSSLTDVKLPASLITIGENTFEGCTLLSSIYIPNSVATIGERAFSGTALTGIELPETLTTLGKYAFLSCNNLESVSVRAMNPPSMFDSDCFSNYTYQNAILKVPLAATQVYTTTDWWNLFVPDNVIGSSDLDHPYDFTVNGIYYLKTGSSTVSVVAGDSPYSGNVDIPATVSNNGITYNVTAIGNSAFEDCTGLTAVSIPGSVTSIGSNAFMNCRSLGSITLPDGLTSIGDNALKGCESISSLTIPQGVTYLGENALAGMTGLTSLTWNAANCWTNGNLATATLRNVTIGEGVELLPWGFVAGAPITSIQFPQSLETIAGSAFEGCNGLTSLTIPEGITAIGSRAFYNCSSLTALHWNARECWTNGDMPTPDITSVSIGNQVEVLPTAFILGSHITAIDIPISVKVIGNSAFSDCTEMTSITIPDSVRNIGALAFNGCTGLTSLTIGKSVDAIADDSFSNSTGLTSLTWNARHCTSNGNMTTSNIEQVTIGNEVEVLPWGFAANSKITHVELPNSLTNIGNENYSEYDRPTGAFENCFSLTNIVIPNSVTTIGIDAFYNCQGITNIEIPSSVTNINSYAFSYCTGLTTFTTGENVERIGSSAFAYCSNLEQVNLNLGLKTIGGNAFYYCWKLQSIDVPNTVTSMRWAFSDCGISYLKLPDGLTSIGMYEFEGCYNLKYINIGSGVRRIASWAFSHSGITSMDIPDNVLEIESYAFEECYDLQSVTIGNGCQYLGQGAFYMCNSLQFISVSEDNPVYDSRNDCNAIIETATNRLVHGCPGSTIPRSVTIIGEGAFDYCPALMEITIPSRVKSIEDDAFGYCPGLTSITCLVKDPIEISDCTFDLCYDATLYVRNESVEAYRNAPVWKNFSYIEGIDYTEPGDLDENGELTISDAINLINLIINNTVVEDPNGDVNGDGIVNISDVIELINTVLNEV